MAFYDVDVERSVLKGLLFGEADYILENNKLTPDDFGDKSHRFIYKKIAGYYDSNYKIIQKNILENEAKRKLKKDKIEVYLILIDKLYSEPLTEKEKKNLKNYVKELIVLKKHRKVQEMVKEAKKEIDSGNGERFYDKHFKDEIDGDSVVRGSYVDDFKKRAIELKDKIEHPEKLIVIPSGIPELDKRIGGGIYSKELGLIVGASNTGKSLMLLQWANAASKQKKNVVYFTIEMDKWNTETRMDSFITGIPFDKFRNPRKFKFDLKDLKIWKRRVRQYREKFGRIEIVSFPKGATMNMIENVLERICEEFIPDCLFIDYLNDIDAERNVKDRGWDKIGEVSWQMKQLTDSFNNNRGIPILTANQATKANKEFTVKKKNQDVRKMDERDVAYSPLPFQHSSVVLGLRENEEEQCVDIIGMKARNSKRNFIVKAYPNFDICRLHVESRRHELLLKDDLSIDENVEVEMER